MPRWPRSARSSNRADAWSIRRTRPNGTRDAIAPAVTRGEAMTPTAHALEAGGARIPLIGLGTWDLGGLARHIGVSNFTVALLEEAVKLAGEPLVCNQIEVHPFLDQSKVMAACRRHGMAVVAYSPIARGGVKNDAVLGEIGRAHGKSAA